MIPEDSEVAGNWRKKSTYPLFQGFFSQVIPNHLIIDMATDAGAEPAAPVVKVEAPELIQQEALGDEELSSL